MNSNFGTYASQPYLSSGKTISFCLPTTYIGNGCANSSGISNTNNNNNNKNSKSASHCQKPPSHDLDDIIEQSFNEISQRLSGELKNRFPNGHKFFSNNNRNGNNGSTGGGGGGGCAINSGDFVAEFNNANVSHMFDGNGNGNSSTTSYSSNTLRSGNVNEPWDVWQQQQHQQQPLGCWPTTNAKKSFNEPEHAATVTADHNQNNNSWSKSRV